MKRLTILIAFIAVFFVVLVQTRLMTEAFDAAVACPVGSWCPVNSVSGIQFLCPAGTYGSTAGLSDPKCTDFCDAGCVCKAGSTVKCAADCPAGFFCVKGTGGEVKPVLCPEGYYCPAKSAIPTACPAGKYCPSGTTGLT